MTRLFDRRIALTVGTTRVEQINVDFVVTRTLEPEPNQGKFAVYNLSETTRKAFESAARRDRVLFSAGYADGVSDIFLGDIVRVYSQREGPDVVTIVEAQDGDESLRKRFARGYDKGVSLSTVLRDLGTALGVGKGNLDQIIATASLEGGGRVFRRGFSVSGDAATELRRVLASCGLEYSIQDGNLQVLRVGRVLDLTAIRLSPDTGLQGIPTLDSKGVLRADCGVIPGLIPGRKIVVDAEFVKGSFRIQRIDYRGSLYSNDFFATIEAREY